MSSSDPASRRRAATLAGVAALALFSRAFAEPPSATLELAAADEPGTRLTLVGTLLDADGHPVAGAELHVYQADAAGRYTPDAPMDEPHARLAGRLRTDADGRFEIRTIRPGAYARPVRLRGRERRIPAHIHLDISAPGHAARRLQIVFADDPLLADPDWKEWVTKLRQPVLDVRPSGRGVAGTLSITLD